MPAPATLGDSTAVETADPAEIAAGRFGGALAFTAADGDHVAWPAALPAASALTIELWAEPDSVAGAQDLFDNSDGRIAVQVVADSPTQVHFAFSIIATTGGPPLTIASASVAAGAWHHVLVSLAAPSIRMWVDGVRYAQADDGGAGEQMHERHRAPDTRADVDKHVGRPDLRGVDDLDQRIDGTRKIRRAASRQLRSVGGQRAQAEHKIEPGVTDVRGDNGDTLHLTITVNSDNAGEGHEYFIIFSQVGDLERTWPVAIAN